MGWVNDLIMNVSNPLGYALDKTGVAKEGTLVHNITNLLPGTTAAPSTWFKLSDYWTGDKPMRNIGDAAGAANTFFATGVNDEMDQAMWRYVAPGVLGAAFGPVVGGAAGAMGGVIAEGGNPDATYGDYLQSVGTSVGVGTMGGSVGNIVGGGAGGIVGGSGSAAGTAGGGASAGFGSAANPSTMGAGAAASGSAQAGGAGVGTGINAALQGYGYVAPDQGQMQDQGQAQPPPPPQPPQQAQMQPPPPPPAPTTSLIAPGETPLSPASPITRAVLKESDKMPNTPFGPDVSPMASYAGGPYDGADPNSLRWWDRVSKQVGSVYNQNPASFNKVLDQLGSGFWSREQGNPFAGIATQLAEADSMSTAVQGEQQTQASDEVASMQAIMDLLKELESPQLSPEVSALSRYNLYEPGDYLSGRKTFSNQRIF